MTTPYAPPVDQLLALGELKWGDRWTDYTELGITPEHVPELIRLLLDKEVFWAESDSAEVWGTTHAWRALGQLRAEAAIEPLLEVLGWDEEADWSLDEIPTVLGMIGPAALEPVRTALARLALDDDERWVATSASNALVEIAKRFPATRDAVVEAIQRQLRWWGRQDPDLNASLVSDLVDLNAVEAAPLIEEAFSAGAVDKSLMGDWEDVQIALGLLAERVTPLEPAFPFGVPFPIQKLLRRATAPPLKASPRDPAAEARRRRKAQKASRQRNRKRKKR